MSEVDAAGFADCSPADRLLAIDQLGALLSATTAELLSLIAVADRAEDWKLDGATGMAPWLVAALRVSSGTAHDWVRSATALQELPAVAEAFDSGVLSWEQVRPATRFATAAEDAALAQDLAGCTVARIEALARERRPRTTDEDDEAARRARFCIRPDRQLGGFRYSGYLPTDRGAHVNQVLDTMAEAAGPDAESGLWAPIEQRRADAICELARVRSSFDADPETSLVVVHVPADVADGHVAGSGAVGDQPVSRETVLRHLCDCRIEYSVDRPDGTTIGIARAGRTVPRWLRRRVARRDGSCRFPGCGRPIRHRHHVEHWGHGGPTDADNLVGLCWHHHRLLHEGRWNAAGDADHEIVFTSPHGRTLTSRPPPLDPAVRHRARRAAGLPDRPRSPTASDGRSDPDEPFDPGAPT